MKRILLVVALVIAIIHCTWPDALAEDKEAAASDTSSAPRLFNPPRVITPGDTAGLKEGLSPGSSEKDLGSEAPGRREGYVGAGRGRFGGGGGPQPGYLFANLEEINAKIKGMGIGDLSENILIWGGKGYARIGSFIIGGGGYGGRTESSGIPDCCARYAEVEVAYGGLILGLSKMDPRYEATAGMLFGGGSIVVERRRNSRYVVGWNGSWDIFDSDVPDSVGTEDLNISSIIKGDFIALEPFVEIKYWVFPFMALDLSASYLRAMIGRGEWTMDNIRIPDSPRTNIGGPSIKLGIHFGV